MDAYAAVKMALSYKGDQISAPILNPTQSPDKDGNYRISWSSVTKAESYILIEANNPEFSNYVYYSNITNTYYDFTDKEKGTYYY